MNKLPPLIPVSLAGTGFKLASASRTQKTRTLPAASVVPGKAHEAHAATSAADTTPTALYAERGRAAQAYVAAQNKASDTPPEGSTKPLLNQDHPILPRTDDLYFVVDRDEDSKSGEEREQESSQEEQTEWFRELIERVQRMIEQPSEEDHTMTIVLNHPLFEHTKLRVHIADDKSVKIDCECAAANEADWFRRHAGMLSAHLTESLTRTAKIQVNHGE